MFWERFAYGRPFVGLDVVRRDERVLDQVDVDCQAVGVHAPGGQRRGAAVVTVEASAVVTVVTVEATLAVTPDVAAGELVSGKAAAVVGIVSVVEPQGSPAFDSGYIQTIQL
jgi:hypothetical protein